MVRVCLLVALGLSQAQDPSTRDDMERFLRTARVVSNVAVGQGVTGARRLELESGGQRHRAVFKTVDNRFEFDYHFGAETAAGFRDSFEHEIAAYKLDKLLGLGLVPPVVEREVDGLRGSLQVWVTREHLRYVRKHPLPAPDRADDDVHAVRLLDYLFNTDRHLRNLFFDEEWRPVVIDQSMAFHALTVPYRPLFRFPREAVARLRALDRRQLESALGRHLEEKQIDALEARRRVVLEQVERAIAERGAAETLFDWDR